MPYDEYSWDLTLAKDVPQIFLFFADLRPSSLRTYQSQNLKKCSIEGSHGKISQTMRLARRASFHSLLSTRDRHLRFQYTWLGKETRTRTDCQQGLGVLWCSSLKRRCWGPEELRGQHFTCSSCAALTFLPECWLYLSCNQLQILWICLLLF